MTVIETRLSVWEALAGRAPGKPLGPADPGLWSAVAERLNPARAKPKLRTGIEQAHLTSARGVEYVMLRSPDGAEACYLRLTPDELRLTALMDGTRTVARLVAEFARIAGRLAPDQVTRIVADLAGNRMLEELPVDAFHRLQRHNRSPWPIRMGRFLLAAAKGQRVVLASIDPIVGFLYKAGGRILFTRPAAIFAAIVAAVGLGFFVYSWALGDQSVFLTSDSYVTGALVLLGLNVFALACHELGHALATKHAGRRVPAAGFLVYFGIPSVFVDTTDVWMAGRKARIITTAAGPATGLVLAGAASIVGFVVPEAAPWTFKLAFAWYLNALFNLNPFLALDGYYLLMDWLEVPNLRARGLAWVAARIRRRPPAFAALDREGRLVALYGMLAVIWVAIAVNIAYRIYTDRVAGLVTGLWRSGWPARILLVAVVAGLAAPLVYVGLSWIGRHARRVRESLIERQAERDAPRRLTALRGTLLGGLPAPALTTLADQGRWVRPRTGEQLVFAGAAQPDVYVVIDGALEARKPGDPTGTVRERVGRGGVVGLSNALTGAPAALSWHTAGTTLLALPSGAVASAVGPLPGPPPVERAELETVLAETPALLQLSPDDRLALVSHARPVMLPPDAPVILPGPTDAIVIASGIVELPEGVELRRGSLIGPYGDGSPGQVAMTRSPTRLWILPAVSGLPLLIGVGAGTETAFGAGRAPVFGVHPPGGYPPLASPPGPPPSKVDEDADRRFERKLWWLLIFFLLFALFLTGSNLFAGPVWAEMPSDRALLQVTRGTASVNVDGVNRTLRRGGEIYVSTGDTIDIADRSTGQLTFRGGSLTVLCGGTEVSMGDMFSGVVKPIQPRAAMTLDAGRVLVDTTGNSAAFEPLALQLAAAGDVQNEGIARFAATRGATLVASGVVRADGGLVPASPNAELTCGDGTPLPRPGTTATLPPSPSESPTPSPTPSPTASPTPSPTPTPSRTPSRTPPRTPPGTTAPPTTGPPPNRAPVISWRTQPGGTIDQGVPGQTPGQLVACNGGFMQPGMSMNLSDDQPVSRATHRMIIRWSSPGFASGERAAGPDGEPWYGSAGPVPWPGTPNNGGVLTITVQAFDSFGAASNVIEGKVNMNPCPSRVD